MQDEKKAEHRKTPSPSKLLKVLVTAGMALAGMTGARAEDKPAPSEEKTSAPADQGDQAKTTKGQEKSNSEKEKDQKEKDKQKKQKKAEDDKKAEEGGGVKGW